VGAALLFGLILLGMATIGRAQSFYYAVVRVTNVTQTGNALTNNGVVRIFTNVQTATTFVTNLTSAAHASTNIWAQIALNRYAGQNVSKTNADTILLQSGSPINLGILGPWGNVTYYTNAGVDGYLLGLPFSRFPIATRTNMASDIVTGLVHAATSVPSAAVALSNHLALGATPGGIIQTAVTEKVFHKLQGTNSGVIHSGGYRGASITNAFLEAVTNRDARLYDSPGQDAIAFYYSGSAASFIQSSANGPYPVLRDGLLGSPLDLLGITPDDQGVILNFKSAVGYFPLLTALPADGTNFWSVANHWGFDFPQIFQGGMRSTNGTNITVYQETVTSRGMNNSNLVAAGTNVIQGDLSFTARTVNSLANGANSVVLGTNVYIRCSGPSAAFSIVGVLTERDGAYHIVQLANPALSCTIANESGSEAVAAQRILTGTAGDLLLTNNPAFFHLLRDDSVSRWRVIAHSR
jgi:hypothetical protein